MSRNIAALIAAAGHSTRMGFTKALLPINRTTFVQNIHEALQNSNLEDIIDDPKDDLLIMGNETEKPFHIHIENWKSESELMEYERELLSDIVYRRIPEEPRKKKQFVVSLSDNPNRALIFNLKKLLRT